MRARDAIALGLLVAFLGLLGVCLVRLFHPLLEGQQWPETSLLVLGFLLTCAGLRRELPLQNVLLAIAIIGVGSLIAAVIGTAMGVPFPGSSPGSTRWKLLPPTFCTLPMLWVVMILSSRGTTRLALVRFREKENFGFRVLGGTAILALIFQFVFDAAPGQPGNLWLSYGFRVVAILCISAVATPTLINKRPFTAPVSFCPAFVWVSAIAYMATAAARLRY